MLLDSVCSKIFRVFKVFKIQFFPRFGIVYQGARPTIFVRDLELLKNICIKDFDHFANFFGDNLDHIVDSNMFFTNGEKWRHAKVMFKIHKPRTGGPKGFAAKAHFSLMGPPPPLLLTRLLYKVELLNNWSLIDFSNTFDHFRVKPRE